MKYKQRKYCQDCEAPFYYSDFDEANPSEPCPVDSEHTTRDHCILSSESYEGFFIESEGEQSTAETDWQDGLIIPVTPDETTKYIFNFSCEVYNSTNNAVTSVRITVDDVEKVISNADCEVDGGIKLEKLISGFLQAEFDASTHIVKVQFRARSGMAYIKRIKFHGLPFCYSEGGGYGYGGS